MYKILVVDDEPAGRRYVSDLIKKYSPEYEVVAIAKNGHEALEKVNLMNLDVVITDIRMPCMDGLMLAKEIRKSKKEIFIVIVSGYSDFEYAKEAIKADVFDYLLKPLVPSDLSELLKKLKEKLDLQYYLKRNNLINNMCKGRPVSKMEVRRYFLSRKYYTAIFRKNGRLNSNVGDDRAIYSVREELFYVYGRDEQEMLYVIPEELLLGRNIEFFTKKLYKKLQNDSEYVTGIYCDSFNNAENLADIVCQLFRRLDETITIGVNILAPLSNRQRTSVCLNVSKNIEFLENKIRLKENKVIEKETRKFIQIMSEQKSPQIYVEAAIEYLFFLIWYTYSPEISFEELNHTVKDMFVCSSNMNEVEETVVSILNQYVFVAKQDRVDEKRFIMEQIKKYIAGHLGDTITVSDICSIFSISQATLSRIFRLYEDISFSEYLTKVRIETAKRIMNEEPQLFIKDISERVGYNDQFYFSRIFRTYIGVSPKEYLESLDNL